MITKVRLKNWKSHEDSELDFAAGTNGLVGIVGSGKTSILDAICFALFGTFPTLQTRKLKIEDVIMKKPIAKNSAEVEVHFVLNGNDYSVRRTIEKQRGTSYSEIKENGRMLESPSTKNVTAIVEKKLKVNYELFSKAIYSEQNAIDYFLTLGKGQRMKKIDELLMIDRFEEARANTVKMTNRIIERRLAKQSTIEQLGIADVQFTIKELKKSTKNLEDEKAELETKLAAVSKKKTETEKEVAELRNVKEKLERLMRDDHGLESAIVVTFDTISRIEKSLKEIELDEEEVDAASVITMLKAQAMKIDEMNAFLEEKQTKYEHAQIELASAKANIKFLQTENISRLEKEFHKKMEIKTEFERLSKKTGKDVDEQMNNSQLALQKLIGDIEATRVRMKDLEEQLEKISDVEGVCPLCGTTLSEEHKMEIIDEKLLELDTLKEKIKQARADKVLTEEKIQKLESAARRLDEMLREIADLEEIKSDLENSKHLYAHHTHSVKILSKQLDSLRREIEIVGAELENTTDTKQRLEIVNSQLKDYEAHKQKIAALEKQQQRLRSGIAGLESRASAEKLEQREKRLRNLIANEKEIEMKIVAAKEMIEERSARLAEHERAIEIMEKEKEEIDHLDKLIKDLKIFTEALRQTQVELRKEFIEAVNYTMNKLWQTLYPYQDFIGIRLAIEEGDYILQLQERAMAWINVEGVASGGERSIACLALRIAFALVLAPHLRMLVLDEPTANLDTNAVKVLATTLREGIGEFIDQCFIITHDEAFEESVTGMAYRLERDKSSDGATRVQQIN